MPVDVGAHLGVISPFFAVVHLGEMDAARCAVSTIRAAGRYASVPRDAAVADRGCPTPTFPSHVEGLDCSVGAQGERARAYLSSVAGISRPRHSSPHRAEGRP